MSMDGGKVLTASPRCRDRNIYYTGQTYGKCSTLCQTLQTHQPPHQLKNNIFPWAYRSSSFVCRLAKLKQSVSPEFKRLYLLWIRWRQQRRRQWKRSFAAKLRLAGMREWRNWCVLELKMTVRDRDQSHKLWHYGEVVGYFRRNRGYAIWKCAGSFAFRRLSLRTA